MANLKNLVAELKALDDKLAKCMRCGTCQSVCPVFTETLKEADGIVSLPMLGEKSSINVGNAAAAILYAVAAKNGMAE